MATCECKGYCGFFQRNEGRFGPIEHILKASLCDRDGIECARHVVFALAGEDAVPSDLFPNDLQGAERLVERHRAQNAPIQPVR